MSTTASPQGRSSGRASVSGAARPAAGGGTAAYRQGAAYGSARPPVSGYDDYDELEPPRRSTGGGGGGRGPGGPGRGAGGGKPYRGRPKPKWGRIALVAGVVAIVLGLIGAGSAYIYASNLDDDLARTDPFSEITGGRPPKTVDGSLNILLVGTDSRDPDAPINDASQWRADTIIVMHIPSDHSEAYLVSIPRDLHVTIPESSDAACGTGSRHKINAAFAFGGLPRAVRTVECMTDVRLDHVMAIDFGGFKEVTDALGGVDLKVERTTKSIHRPFRTFKKGVNHMNGAEALDWIRQRKQFPDGDFARMRHQQEFLRALMDKAVSSGTLANPGKLNAFLKATTAAVTVDEGFSIVDMALQFRNLRGENLHFLTNPNVGSETIGGESVVVSDREKAIAMYKAMTEDKMKEWVAANDPKAKPSAGT
ncbi:LCP family protein [Spirilliplanes yamanashiensis]|uniref:LCP family protein n=1 Tax=Spirilliplanes yamanashiensis TaxID=42233 RepID=UPI0019520222|nr:LCP family protein [Spirilliplanes yamanashiensis]